MPKIDWWRLLPCYWAQNYPTVRLWDDALNALLAKGPVTEVGEHTCRVAGVKVWISNWPYAFGRPVNCEYLPMVSTRRRLRKIVWAAQIERAKANAQ